MSQVINRSAAIAMTATAALLTATPVFGAVPVPQALPPGSITHQNSQYWTWAGPSNWVSVDGAYGIKIESGNGLLTLDRGFSSVVCASGNNVQESVTAYYAQQRATLRDSLRANWRKVGMEAERVQQLPQTAYGPLYFRQSFKISGKAQGRRFGGVVQYDYSLANGPTYCYARNTARTAPASNLRKSMRQLASVEASLAYFGPGV